VNVQHLRAFLWLRWRLRVNQLRKGGTANAVILAILMALTVLVALCLFAGALLVGWFALRDTSSLAILFVWDGLVVAFLFFWATGLLAELQRAEALSLDKFLHLPVSLTGAFLVNYLSSMLSVTLVLFLAAMAGLSLGLLFSRGPMLLGLLPLVAAFVLMVTAVTYQFQGWLASLMANKRRRQTIIVLVTAVFILLSNLPNLLNLTGAWGNGQPGQYATRLAKEQAEISRQLAKGQITPAEYSKRLEELQQKHQAEAAQAEQQLRQKAERVGRVVNLVFPPGWLPLGAAALVQGDFLPAALGTIGLALIGAASLWRSYRTTVRLYTGQFTSSRPRRATPAPAKAEKPSVNLIEQDIPWISEQAAAIALGGLRSLLRAPEAKMMLLTPVILVVLFGAMFLTRRTEIPDDLRPLTATAGLMMMLYSAAQLVGNQFGFDRAGFRVFVLCPARRRDVLLGKNLAFAPLALGLSLAIVILLQAVSPMRIDHFLAILPQAISMYLVFCLLANLLSILAPMPIAAGSMKPTNVKVIPVLLHLAFFFVLPLAVAPTLLPLGVEYLLEGLGLVHGLPVCLGLSLLEAVAIIFLYRLVLTWEGILLQIREKKILEIVAAKAE
jgi:hypothetical protein